MSAGQASITTAPNSTTIDQTSQRAVIDWNSFNIGAGQAVRFDQPSAAAIALNIVPDSGTSRIDGQLLANGNVWLMNPDGVAFSKTAQVNVGGLLATTSTISEGCFMAGKYAFTPGGNPGAAVSNAGQITVAQSGLAALVAPNVANSGTITAKLGKIELASGDTFTLDLYGDGLVNLQASKALTSQLVANHGRILADGGNVTLTTAAAGALVSSLVNMDGLIEADTADGKTGSVTLKTDGTTDFSGRINARGGAEGGNGGNVEVSGDKLDFTGFVDTSAPKGKAGTLLLDPTDLYIIADGIPPEATASAIPAGLVEAELYSGNLTLSTSSTATAGQHGDITVLAPFNWVSPYRLTLTAARNINVDAAVSTSGGGVAFNYAAGGALSFNNGGTLTYTAPSGSLAVNGKAFTLESNFSALKSAVAADPSGDFALANNVSASGTTYAAAPLGTFGGTLEGLGHTLSGLTVSVTDLPSGPTIAAGLFGNLTGTVDGLNLTGASVTGVTVTGPNYNGYELGTLAGQNSGTVFNSSATGAVSCGAEYACGAGGLVGLNSGTVRQSHADVNVGGSGDVFGGLVASNQGIVAQSYASGAVSGANPVFLDSGGLVGWNLDTGVINNGYATGPVLAGGGLVGANEGLVETSYATGKVTAGDGVSAPAQGGGLFAYNGAAGVVSSYWDTQSTGQATATSPSNDGGAVTGATGRTTAELQAALPAGFSAAVWEIDAGVAGGLPSFLWQQPYASTVPMVNGFPWYDPRANGFSSTKPNWHSYYVVTGSGNGDLLCFLSVCPATTVAGDMLRYAYPGQNAGDPVVSGRDYNVYGPSGTGGPVLVGGVQTLVFDGGLGLTNTTLDDHLLYNGTIARMAYESQGKWYVTTVGYGNNTTLYWSYINQYLGPTIFKQLDTLLELQLGG